jgi:prepilin-type N-terminal cleavage/methylation domain-containing protein
MNRKSGFSLAELLMVVAIMGILAGFGFVGVIGAQRNLKRTEMDNIAREIFLAAQNNLTEKASTGEWKKIYQEYSNDKSSDSYLGADATDEIKDAADKPASITDANISTDHDFRVLTYSEKSASSSLLDKKNSALGILLPFGSTDDTVRSGGSYIIEYDAETATVYGVFYTDSSVGITTTDITPGNDTTSLNDGRKDATIRRDYTKKDASGNSVRVTVGYYGGTVAEDASYDATKDSDTTKVPSLSDVTLKFVNGDRLLLVMDDPNPGSIFTTETVGQNISYQVTITLQDTSTGKTDDVVVLTYNGNTDPKVSPQSAGITDKAADNCRQTVCILDSIVDQDCHFAQLFPELTPGDAVKATVKLSILKDGKEVAAKSCSTADTANSLFDDATSASGAVISNARHLENLSEDVSGVSGVRSAQITSDIDWSTFTKDVTTSDAYGISTPSCTVKFLQKGTDGKYTTRDDAQSNTFYGIVNSKLSTLQGSVKGSDGKTVPAVLSNFDIEPDSADTAKKSSGLIAVADHTMSISDLTLKNFKVNQTSGGTNAGAVVGLATQKDASTSSRLSIKNVTVTGASVGSADKTSANVGGMVGAVNEGSVLISGSNLTGSNTLRGTVAGGILGNAMNTADDTNALKANAGMPSVMINKCTVGGADTDGNNTLTVESTQIAGGLVGQYSLQGASEGWSKTDACSIVESTISADSVNITSGQGASDSSVSYAAGGLVGDIEDASSLAINHCLITSKSLTISSNAGSATRIAAGGLIGAVHASDNQTRSAVSVTVSNCTVGSSADGSSVELSSKAEKGNAGGLIGSLYAKTEEGTIDSPVVAIDSCKLDTPSLTVDVSAAASGAIASAENMALQVNNCSVCGGADGTVTASGNSGNAGGFIGSFTGNDASFTACSTNLLVRICLKINA